MTPLDLHEFAESLYMEGNPFAAEILELLILREDMEGTYLYLTGELDRIAPDDLKPGKTKLSSEDRYARILERLTDRVDVLDAIEETLRSHDRTGDADDEVKEILDTLSDAEGCLRNRGHWQSGEFLDALFELAERPPKRYDL